MAMRDSCPGQEEMIYLLLDDELKPAVREDFLAHLAGCPACQDRLAQAETLFAALEGLEQLEPPPKIVPGVMNRLPAPERWTTTVRVILAAEIIIGLALLLTYLPAASPPFPDSRLWRLPWLILVDILASSAGWLQELPQGINRFIQSQWPLRPDLAAGLPSSTETAVTVVIGLGLACLIGNALLLGRRNRPLGFIHRSYVE